MFLHEGIQTSALGNTRRFSFLDGFDAKFYAPMSPAPRSNLTRASYATAFSPRVYRHEDREAQIATGTPSSAPNRSVPRQRRSRSSRVSFSYILQPQLIARQIIDGRGGGQYGGNGIFAAFCKSGDRR